MYNVLVKDKMRPAFYLSKNMWSAKQFLVKNADF